MPKATVGANLLQPFQVITELGINTVGKDLRVFAVDDIFLPVQEPGRDLELGGVLDDGHQSLKLVRVEITGPEQMGIPGRQKPGQPYGE